MALNGGRLGHILCLVGLPVSMLVVDTSLVLLAENQGTPVPCVLDFSNVPERPAILAGWLLNGPGFLGIEQGWLWDHRPIPSLRFSSALYTAVPFWLGIGVWLDRRRLKLYRELLRNRALLLTLLGVALCLVAWACAEKVKYVLQGWTTLSQSDWEALAHKHYPIDAMSQTVLVAWYFVIALLLARCTLRTILERSARQ